ncbi:MAG: L-seryl-tRNA(Sec) selenium transferase, partial [Acidobacteriota bacterium]|nr:L-seryl-tRNA(Sec) selenium transferase [Acidobacteriota bacterium]
MKTLRTLPSIDHLRQRAVIRALETDYGPVAALAALRTVVEDLRQQIGGPNPPPLDDREHAAITIERHTALKLAAEFEPSLTSVINATGVIVHTNLGRAPLAATVAQRVAQLAVGYANLEYDLTAGRRGARHIHSAHLLTRITGAQAAVVVNNNAAAVLLILSALASGREAIVSRGELVEIGGGFRIPDIMRQSGTQL